MKQKTTLNAHSHSRSLRGTTVAHSGDVVVIRPKGKITIDGGDAAMRKLVRQALDHGARRILIDLGKVARIDSAGIGELVAAHIEGAARHASIRLCGVSSKVLSTLQLMELLTVFQVFSTQEEALDSFAE